MTLRAAARSLGRSKLYFATAVPTLAVAVGAGAATFAAIYGLLWKPLPYRRGPGPLVAIEEIARTGSVGNTAPLPLARLWAAAGYPLSATAEWQFTEPFIGARGISAGRPAASVSRDLLSVLGVRLERGGGFGPGQRQVILTASAARALGPRGDVGQLIRVNRRACRIVGVLPPSFLFPARMQPVLLLPLPPTPPGSTRMVFVVARLRPGIKGAAAARALAELQRSRASRLPAYLGPMLRSSRPRVLPLREQWTATVRPILWAAFAGALCLLAAAWAGLLGLGMARQAERRRELAVRVALGAAPRQTLRAAAVEGIFVAVVGGVAGIALGALGFRLLRAAGLPVGANGFGSAALAFGVLLLGCSVVLVGLLPGMSAARAWPAAALRSAGPTATAPGTGLRMLVAMEAALAVLLACAGLLLARTVANLLAIRPGFRISHTLVVRLAGPRPPAEEDLQASATLRGIRALPGVRAAGIIGSPPLGGVLGTEAVATAPGSTTRQIGFTTASPGFLSAEGIRLLEGRGFENSDGPHGAAVALVNEAFARQVFGHSAAVGGYLQVGHPATATRIVGVIADARQLALDRPAQPEIIFPYAQWGDWGSTFVVWTQARPLALLPALRTLVRSTAPGSVLVGATTTGAIWTYATAKPRAETALFSLLAGLTLALAFFGVYGVAALETRTRRREIAVRKAVGAADREILLAALRRAMTPALIGIGAGALGATVLTRWLVSLLYGVRPLDPAAFALAGALTLAITVGASLPPARRAASVDPVILLREE